MEGGGEAYAEEEEEEEEEEGEEEEVGEAGTLVEEEGVEKCEGGGFATFGRT